jgi:hypothetical protein
VIAPNPGITIPCLAAGICSALPSLGSSLGGSIANAAASGVLDAIASALSASAAWLLGHLIDLVNETSPVDLGSTWFLDRESAMASLLELVVLPLLMAATAGAVLRQDLKRLARVWIVGLPVAAVVGVLAVQFADVALSATDAMCAMVINGSGGQISGRFSDIMFDGLVTGAPLVVRVVVFMLLIVGSVLVWIELLLRASAVYIAMFFMPLALAAYVWPPTAVMARRTLELVAALILSKFVIVAALTLGLAALASGTSTDDDIAAGAILLLAGFAPFCLLRLAPIVETAAIAHLEGASRRPFRAASRAATAVVPGAAQHPAARMLLAKMRGSSGELRPSPVGPQPLPQRRPDYPTTADGDARDG